MNPLSVRPRTRRERSRGQSLVEFALVLPVFLLFLLGLVEGARLVYANSVIAHAAQQGARLAALASTGSEAAVKASIKSHATGVSVSDTDIAITVNGVAGTYTSRTPGARVKITVAHTFRPVLSSLFGSVSISLRGEAEIRAEGS